jgi:hypothetical protein
MGQTAAILLPLWGRERDASSARGRVLIAQARSTEDKTPAIDGYCAFRYDSAVIIDFGYVAWPASFA